MAQIGPSAGSLRARLQFQRRGDGDDGWGGTRPGAGPFTTQFSAWAALRPLRGSEAVMADRLSGRQPYVLRVRSTPATRGVTTAWQLVGSDGRVFAVTSPLADPDGKRTWLEGIVTEGVAS